MTMLSTHFSLREATATQVGERRGIANEPNAQELAAMRLVAANILEPVRLHYGVPFAPNSFFRSERVNFLVGGAPGSQHRKGEAVDFEVPGVSNYDLACWIRDNLRFDQLILEFYKPGNPTSGWVHCSYKAKDNRTETLTISNGKTSKGLLQ